MVTTVAYKAFIEVVNLPTDFLYNPSMVYVGVKDGWVSVVFYVGDQKLNQMKDFKISN